MQSHLPIGDKPHIVFAPMPTLSEPEANQLLTFAAMFGVFNLITSRASCHFYISEIWIYRGAPRLAIRAGRTCHQLVAPLLIRLDKNGFRDDWA
jgi:hypothetical protein